MCTAVRIKATVCFLLLLAIFDDATSLTCEPPEGESDESTFVEDTFPTKALKVRKKCNTDWSVTYDLSDDGYVRVDCGICAIYKLEVRAWRNTQEDPNMCWGLTPELLTSHKECYFKNNCNLRYSLSPIIWVPPKETQDVNCLGDEPATATVGYKCLETDAVPVHQVMKGFQAVESLRGLVRSHSYHAKDRLPYPRYFNKRHIIEISPPANFKVSSNFRYVLVSVLTASIADGDKLTMRDKVYLNSNQTCEVTTWTTNDTHNMTATTLYLEFMLNSQLPSGAGFDICFQWFDVGDTKASVTFNQTVKSCKKAMESKEGFPTFNIIEDNVTQEYKGIIRSHSRFPWNYPRPALEDSEYSGNLRHSTCHVLRAPNNLRNLVIYVENMDLGKRDKFQICGGNKIVSSGTELEVNTSHNFTSDTVTLNFTVWYSMEHTNSGFLLCYRWFSRDHPLSSTNPCETHKHDVGPCADKKKQVSLRKICKIRKERKKEKKKPSKSKKDNRKTNQ